MFVVGVDDEGKDDLGDDDGDDDDDERVEMNPKVENHFIK